MSLHATENVFVPNVLLDPSERSALMARIRSKNTKPELVAFAELRARGISFQRHYDKVPGKPDVAKPRKKLAVFIDGDFWHGREFDRIATKYGPANSWTLKLQRNISRDLEQVALLESAGWLVLRVWESDVMRKRTRAETMDRVATFLRCRD
jgi:DNA mismatch endonuclease, patch repair protein